MTGPTTCAEHLAVPAGFRCTGCGRLWCDACGAAAAGPAGVRFCKRCRGILAEHRPAVPPDDLRSLAGRFVTGEALLTLGLLSLPAMAAGLPFVGFILMFIYAGLVSAYADETVDHVACRRPGLPFGAPMLDWIGLGQKTLRGVLALGVAVGPALVAWFYEGTLPLIIGLLMLGLSLAPASWLAGIVTRHAANQIYPPALWELVLRNPGAYLRLCMWFYGAGAVIVATTVWLGWLLAPLGLLQTIVLPLPVTFGTAFIGAIFGRHLQHHAGDYGLRYQ